MIDPKKNGNRTLRVRYDSGAIFVGPAIITDEGIRSSCWAEPHPCSSDARTEACHCTWLRWKRRRRMMVHAWTRL